MQRKGVVEKIVADVLREFCREIWDSVARSLSGICGGSVEGGVVVVE